MATVLSTEKTSERYRAPAEIEVPASTAWPFVLAFGLALLFAGLLTSVSVSALGAVLTSVGPVSDASDQPCNAIPETERIVRSIDERTRSCSSAWCDSAM